MAGRYSLPHPHCCLPQMSGKASHPCTSGMVHNLPCRCLCLQDEVQVQVLPSGTLCPRSSCQLPSNPPHYTCKLWHVPAPSWAASPPGQSLWAKTVFSLFSTPCSPSCNHVLVTLCLSPTLICSSSRDCIGVLSAWHFLSP